ncbi:MAG: hypothetical protein JRI68_09045 [Deltaproteobacteria bacterium]|nr:hypothetical protein [Deltaproteobacteria bacterium]
MLSRQLIHFTTAMALALGAVAIGACGVRSSQQSDDAYNNTEIEACEECKAILVECSSTSTDESQFVECRDQWLDCQRGRGLGPDMCGNPSDDEACYLCRERLTECKATAADPAGCETQFSVCKAFLITRGDLADGCTEFVNVSPEAACNICQKDLAACVSDGTGQNTIELCSSKFGQCVDANGITVEECGLPTGTGACDLCTEHHDDCAAAAGTDCVANFEACSTTIASDVVCELSGGGTGGGGTGGGGAGGGGAGGGLPTSCAHDPCVAGDKLEYSCDLCVMLVCDQDSYCCENEWDSYCLDTAATITECGC